MTNNLYKIEKETLKEARWNDIFNTLERDAALISRFVKSARKMKKIPANDMDSILEEIAKHTRNHIEVNSSGIVEFF